MAYPGGQPAYITTQPQPQVVVMANPFQQQTAEWSAGLCDCCDDMGQCEFLIALANIESFVIPID